MTKTQENNKEFNEENITEEIFPNTEQIPTIDKNPNDFKRVESLRNGKEVPPPKEPIDYLKFRNYGVTLIDKKLKEKLLSIEKRNKYIIQAMIREINDLRKYLAGQKCQNENFWKNKGIRKNDPQFLNNLKNSDLSKYSNLNLKPDKYLTYMAYTHVEQIIKDYGEKGFEDGFQLHIENNSYQFLPEKRAKKLFSQYNLNKKYFYISEDIHFSYTKYGDNPAHFASYAPNISLGEIIKDRYFSPAHKYTIIQGRENIYTGKIVIPKYIGVGIGRIKEGDDYRIAFVIVETAGDK